MNLENKKAVAVGKRKDIESICRICAYRGCTNCPSLVPVRGRNEKIEDFPQVKRGIELKNGKIIVLACEDFYRRKKDKEQNQRAQYEWDMRQRKFVKVVNF